MGSVDILFLKWKSRRGSNSDLVVSTPSLGWGMTKKHLFCSVTCTPKRESNGNNAVACISNERFPTIPITSSCLISELNNLSAIYSSKYLAPESLRTETSKIVTENGIRNLGPCPISKTSIDICLELEKSWRIPVHTDEIIEQSINSTSLAGTGFSNKIIVFCIFNSTNGKDDPFSESTPS